MHRAGPLRPAANTLAAVALAALLGGCGAAASPSAPAASPAPRVIVTPAPPSSRDVSEADNGSTVS
ncbi:MAG: hypothetical protein E6I76_07030, partial [Chloroflexi bacterium]